MWNESPDLPDTGGSRPVAAPHAGLGEAEIRAALRMLPALGTGWSLFPNEDCEGGALLLIERDTDDTDGADVDAAPADIGFSLCAGAAGVQLGLIVDERFECAGRYDTVGLAMRRACQLLAERGLGYGRAAA